jgi:hypothetical protein
VQWGYFDGFIMVCIVFNITTMAMTYEGSLPAYDGALETINLVFTSVFITETALKIIAYGFKGTVFNPLSQLSGHPGGINSISSSLSLPSSISF